MRRWFAVTRIVVTKQFSTQFQRYYVTNMSVSGTSNHSHTISINLPDTDTTTQLYKIKCYMLQQAKLSSTTTIQLPLPHISTTYKQQQQSNNVEATQNHTTPESNNTTWSDMLHYLRVAVLSIDDMPYALVSQYKHSQHIIINPISRTNETAVWYLLKSVLESEQHIDKKALHDAIQTVNQYIIDIPTYTTDNQHKISINEYFQFVRSDVELQNILYKPYKLQDTTNDWVTQLKLNTSHPTDIKPVPAKVLVLYGSLRTTSYTKLLAYEYARILDRYGCDVYVYNPVNLPMKDDQATSLDHFKIQELRCLSDWSTGHVWCSPEQHGTITGVMKNQIDWIPLELGSVRPTQGKILLVAQGNGGSQSFNVVNILRLLGRWMRMYVICNQSSIPKIYTEFDKDGRMKESAYRQRLVDVAEEFWKFSCIIPQYTEWLTDRFSERKEIEAHQRLLSQEEKENMKNKT